MDLARIGFSADTSDLADAKQSLEQLVPAAKRVERAADNMGSSLRQAAAGGTASSANLGRAALGVSRGFDVLTGKVNNNFAAINGVIAGWNRASAAAGQADAHVQAYRNALASASVAAQQASASANNTAASIAKITPASVSAASSLNRLGAAANDNINRLQSTPGNIAAQFQDIGVSAAGGMAPFLIALQQGTQLSSAMSGGLGNLFAGFRQLFSLTSIVTIVLVGLVAAGLQNIDWMQLADTLLRGLADGLDVLADAVEEASVALLYFSVVAAVAFGPAILSRIGVMAVAIGHSLVTAISTATLAMISFSLANPFGALVIGAGLVIAAMLVLNDAFGGIFTDILAIIRQVANGIIRLFAYAFNQVVQRAQSAAQAIVSVFNAVTGVLGIDVQLNNPNFAGALIEDIAGRDFVGEIGTGIGNVVSDIASRARGLADGLLGGGDPASAGGASSSAAAGRQSEAQRQADAYDEIVKGSMAATAALITEATALGMSENAARLYRNEQDLLAQATERVGRLTLDQQNELLDLAATLTQAEIAVETAKMTKAFNDQMQALQDDAALIGLYGLELEYARVRQDLLNQAQRSGIIDLNNMTDATRAFVAALGDQAISIAQSSESNRRAKFVEDFRRGLRLSTFELQRQAGELNLAGAALEAYRIETDLLAQAKRNNITLDPAVVAGIRAQAVEYAMLNEQITQQQRNLQLGRETLRGFFGDLVSNLQQGQSAWQAFGNAVNNVVNRILDRLLDLAAEEAFNTLLSLVGQVSGSEVARLSGSAADTIASNPGLFAKGGAFQGGVQKFANGGAFTNGIYSSPTMFQFANGGSFGVMGEAGAEAVMPLKRGSDGSLGVQVQGMEPQMIVVRVVTDDERFDAYVDGRIGESAPQVAQAGATISARERAFINSRRIGS